MTMIAVEFATALSPVLSTGGQDRIPAVSKTLGDAGAHTTTAYYAHLDAEGGREDLAAL